MSSRRAFITSQKRRLGEEPSELEPSSSRMRSSSPPTTSSPGPSNLTGAIETEFDERVSEASDYEHEEQELDSENDYQEEEDRVLRKECVSECAKEGYSNSWSKDQPSYIPDKFHFLIDLIYYSPFKFPRLFHKIF
jgi:hypothetical protein